MQPEFPTTRAAASASIAGHCARLAEDLAAAIARYGAPEGVARDSVRHLRRYVLMLFKKGNET